jgi:hypothetical protein
MAVNELQTVFCEQMNEASSELAVEQWLNCCDINDA